MQTLLQDLRYGARMLIKNPGFTLIAVLTLALGIGANTAIFSVVNAFLFRPVPAAAPDELARVFFGSQKRARVYDEISWPNYVDLKAQSQSFSDLLGFRMTWAALSASGSREAGERAEIIFGELVTGNYFDLLGVKPARGRAFLPAEGSEPNKHPVVVLSHGIWQRRFNADAAIIGKTVFLSGKPFTVVGVAPEFFKGMKYPLAMDFWAPVMMREQLTDDKAWVTDRGRDLLSVVGRLKPGVTIAQAETELTLIGRNLAQAYPAANADTKMQVAPEAEGRLTDGFPIIRFSGLAALAVAGLVLLIACANVANLTLARATARNREIGVRLALGASRARIVRQLLTESLLLSALGGAFGLLLTFWSGDLMRASIPPFVYRLDLDFAPDWRVFRWALIVSLLTGIVFGLAPALRAARTDLIPVLKGATAATTTSRGRRRLKLRDALVVAQLAVSIIVLVCAGLFIRSLRNVQATDPGFRADKLISLALDPSLLGYNETEGKRFFAELSRRIGELPRVRSAAVANLLPLSDISNSTGPVVREGEPPPQPNQGMNSRWQSIGPNYFATAGTQLVAGRELTERDTNEAPPVVIINQELARRLYGSEQAALGKRLRIGDANSPLVEIVGVARDGKYSNIYEDPRPYLFFPHTQRFYDSTAMVIASVNSANDLPAIAEAMRREAQKLDGRVPVAGVKTGRQHLSWAYWGPRLGAGMALSVGVLALLLATMGLYGVMSYAVSQRTREIGIRLALGAQSGAVLKLVLKQGMWLALIGAGIGLAAAVGLTRVMKSLLFGVSATDPLTFALISLLLVFVALLACWIPARRATKVDPMAALRNE